ncbi:S41 family peptidase [Streptomyces sp. NPDC059637]|uniref:S41 family peptidase n=1 Tax=Streptomyces sp. NPDC059637 TaxID=3347752 RepID=UPI0036CBDE84
MSGSSTPGTPRRSRRGATLTLVFGAVVAAGASSGGWPALGGSAPGTHAVPAAVSDDAAAAAEAGELRAAIERDDPEAAEELVSRSGDRWAAFYTAREYEGLRRSLDGRYVGVGLWVRRTADGGVEVCRVQPGGPAAGGGVRVGDRLRAVDGTRTGGLSVTEVVALLRGEAGSRVELELRRGERAREVTLERAVLATEEVSVERMGGRVTRIRIASFTKGVGGQVREALEGAGAARGAAGGGGVVLDLRGNSGGLVAEAVSVASAFLDGGLVATYDVRGSQRVLDADEGGDTATPLVVLVDGGTMSAAELLAGALQDRGRAVLVGSRTFGKGSVQMPSTLSDGSVVEQTVGHYRTPSGRSVDGAGVVPDLKVPAAAEPAAADAKAVTVLSGLGGRP